METTSQDDFDLILKASNEGVWDWVVGEDDIFYSPKVFEFFEREKDEKVPNLFTQMKEVFYKEDVGYFKTLLDLTLSDESEDLFAIDCRIVCPSGELRWLRIRGIVSWLDGEAIRMTGSMIDISKRKKAEEALEDERSMLRLVIDNVPVQVFFKDRESRYVLVNQRQCDWLGAEHPEELLGRTPESYFAGDHWEKSRKNDLRIMETGKSTVGEIFKESWKDKPDTYVQLVKCPWYDSQGLLKGTFGISTDVTKLMKSQDHLEELALDLQMRNEEYREKLNLAREVQQAMLPGSSGIWEERLACVKNYADVAQLYISATELGGDYYDVLPLGDGKVGLFVADVMGHGVRSALVVNMLKGVMEQAKGYADHPVEFMSRLNGGLRRILGKSEVHMFATACYVVLDFLDDKISVVSAGHDFPVVRWRDQRNGFNGDLQKGAALGFFDEVNYNGASCKLSEVDSLLIFTDGIYESSNEYDEEWGKDKLEEAFCSSKEEGIDGVLGEVEALAIDWVGEEGFDDDVCLLSVRMKNREGGDYVAS